MIAAVVNAVVVVLGALIGNFVKGALPKRFSDILLQAMALSVMLIGLLGAMKAEDAIAVILCLAIGGVLGELLKIEQRLEKLGEIIKKRFAKNGQDGFAQGFVSASLLFCVGAMAVVGSLDAGLNADYTTIFAKSLIDCVTAVVLSSTMGLGVAFSAVTILLYQGGITLAASLLVPVLSTGVVALMSAVGSLLIVGIGFNMLGFVKIKVGNLLPAVFIAIAYVPIATWLTTLF